MRIQSLKNQATRYFYYTKIGPVDRIVLQAKMYRHTTISVLTTGKSRPDIYQQCTLHKLPFRICTVLPSETIAQQGTYE